MCILFEFQLFCDYIHIAISFQIRIALGNGVWGRLQQKSRMKCVFWVDKTFMRSL